MLRTALRPKFVGLLLLGLAFATLFALLGRWQLDVAEHKAEDAAIAAARDAPIRDLTEVIAPHSSYPPGQDLARVRTRGTYAAADQFIVPDRRLRGASGAWVVAPLDVEGSGGRIAVVRGFVTDPASVPAPPAGPVELTGTLTQGEAPTTRDYPEGQLGSIDLAVLVNRWPQDLYNAFIFAESEDPAATAPIERVPSPAPASGLTWRNAAYAVQWWMFAGFVFWLWWRMVRSETDARRRDASPSGPPEPGPGEADEEPRRDPAPTERGRS